MNKLPKALALSVAIALTGCAKEDPQQFIQEGKALFEKGELKAAKVQFKNALQLNPQLAEGYYGLALLDEKAKNWGAMKTNLQEVIRQAPGHVEARVKLGFLLITDLDKAKEHAEASLKAEPENSKAILLDGRLRYEEGNYKEALRQAGRVLIKQPNSPKAFWLKAYTLMAQEQYDLALDALNKGLEKSPDNVGLASLKVKLHEKQKQFDEVLKDFDYLVTRHPEDKKTRIDRINALVRYENVDRAEEALIETIKKYPEDIGLKLQLVNFIAANAGLERAEAQLKSFISTEPKEVRLKNRLAKLYLAKKQIPEAQAVLNEVVSADSIGREGLAAKVRLAELAWAQNDKKLAEKLTAEVIKVDAGNSGALMNRAGLRFAELDMDGAISDLRIVLRDQPNSGQAMVMMGQVYAAKGEFEVAESHWRKALEVNPGSLAALTPLTSALFKRGDAVRAEELINKALKGSPADTAMLKLQVQARAAQKDWAGAESSVNELRKQPGAAFAAQMLDGMLEASQGKHLEAIQTYKDILAARPGAADVMSLMARSYEAAGKRDEYFAYLKSFINQNPGSITARNMLALAYSAEKKWVEAGKTLQASLKQDPEAITTYKLLAGVLTQQSKGSHVPGLYRKGLEVSPNNEELMLELAKHYDGVKDYKAAITAYADMLDKYPDNDEAANNLAYLLVEYGLAPDSFGQALVLAERFKNSSNPYFLDTYGWVLLKSGKAGDAVEIFKKAVMFVPRSPEFHFHLGEAFYEAGDKNAAKLELEKTLLLTQKSSVFAHIDRVNELMKKVGS